MVRSNARRLWMAFLMCGITAACLGGGPTPTGAPSATVAPSAAGVTQPSRPVQLVIGSAPGEPADAYARLWRDILEKDRLSPQPVQALNKEGGSGAVAFTYVFQKKGDMHVLVGTSTSFFTTIVTQKLPFKATDFTPIASMALDPFFLWVNDDSSWKTAEDFVRSAKAGSLVVAGTGSQGVDEALFDDIADTAGTKPFTFVPQTNAGNTTMALAGHVGGVVATVSHPSDGLGLYQATPRKMRPLCAFVPDSPKSGPYAGLATCKSQGIAIDDYYDVRMILGPPGLTVAEQKFWSDAFNRVYDSTDWKTFMTDNMLEPDFRGGAALGQLVTQYQQLHQHIATAFRWVQ